jgi:hypothetical protein
VSHYFWHYVANKMLTLLSDIFTNLKLTDMETCYKVFRREVLQGITLKSDRFGFEPEITAKVAKGDWRIYEVPSPTPAAPTKKARKSPGKMASRLSGASSASASPTRRTAGQPRWYGLAVAKRLKPVAR